MVENFKNVRSEAVDDETLIALARAAIHVAVQREEARESQDYSDEQMYTEKDPFTREVRKLVRTYPAR